MLCLFGYVAYSSISNYDNLDRAPVLLKATAEPLTDFVSLLQAERRAAVVYLAHPSGASLAAYQGAVQATAIRGVSLEAMVNSPASEQNATPAEAAAIRAMVVDVKSMTTLRARVTGRKLSALAAFAAYSTLIADQEPVLLSEAGSMTEAVASSPALGLISAISAREDVSEQDALLAAAFAAGSLTTPERIAFSNAVGRQADDMLTSQALLTAPELTIYNSVMDAKAPVALQGELAQVQQGVEGGLSLASIESRGLSAASWQQLTATWQRANYAADTDAANIALSVDESLAGNAQDQVRETGSLGALGLLLTLAVTILLARSIHRRLTQLRRSALALANHQLPAVVARLRQGDAVDIAPEAAPMLVGSDEIGQVAHAIDVVRQSAVRSAVEAAEQTRLRLGVNDMFRNLARRNQSLLQRQLSVLDEMEHRVTDPDVLADLFRMDHLTTRMRRHAEGLIILSGAPPGRSWTAPVTLIDVMRGAIAEVEDYARVTVSTQANAGLAGSAVADVIHLLAELIENATTLSPPFTQVQVGGESVAHGFAIVVEDRGLGMSPDRLDELNDRITYPPELNPANAGQLGLIVVGQLARRHGITVTLRPSTHGGTKAVAVIPSALIVGDGPVEFTAGAPGTAMASGPVNADQTGSAGPAGPARSVGAIPAPSPLQDPEVLPSRVRTTGAHRAGPAERAPAAASGGPRLAASRPDDVPVVTGVSAGRPTGSHADSLGTPFDAFALVRSPRPEPAQSASPVPGSGGGSSGADDEGLPRRVRQASLAPELRVTSADASGSRDDPAASAESLAVMRSTLASMQRGWQQGRSESRGHAEGPAHDG